MSKPVIAVVVCILVAVLASLAWVPSMPQENGRPVPDARYEVRLEQAQVAEELESSRQKRLSEARAEIERLGVTDADIAAIKAKKNDPVHELTRRRLGLDYLPVLTTDEQLALRARWVLDHEQRPTRVPARPLPPSMLQRMEFVEFERIGSTGQRSSLVWWPLFLVEQALILLLGGGLLTFVVRRERRRKAAA